MLQKILDEYMANPPVINNPKVQTKEDIKESKKNLQFLKKKLSKEFKRIEKVELIQVCSNKKIDTSLTPKNLLELINPLGASSLKSNSIIYSSLFNFEWAVSKIKFTHPFCIIPIHIYFYGTLFTS